MLSDIEICNTLGKPKEYKDLHLKEKVEDFIVQEVVNGVKCEISSLIDLEMFYKAENILKDIPKTELTKEERREIYSIINHHPILRTYTKDSKFIIEEKLEDIFVFTLLKYDYSYNSLINLISNRLGVNQNCIQTGGTKDKRGITLQEISAKCSFDVLFNYALSLNKNESLKIPELGYNKSIEDTNEKIKEEISKYIEILPPENSDPIMIFNIRRGNPKRLGDLDGNFFNIKIRNLFGLESNQTEFLNYFGPQRFGLNFNNHEIGKHILDEKYDQALDLILADETNHNPVQKMILRLREQKNKAKFIVSRLPRHVQMMYLHAYQSFIFNKSVNERLEKGSPVVGQDKVMRNNTLEDVNGSELLRDVYIPLPKMESKFLRGSYRKMIEEIKELSYKEDSEGTTVSFYLNKSCYATVALRELVGDFSMNSIE